MLNNKRHSPWLRLAALSFIALTATGQVVLSDSETQSALDSGRGAKTKALWGEIEKHQTVRINRQGFGDTVGKSVTFLSDRDLIALAAAEASRRHQALSVADVKLWPGMGTTHALLVVVAGGMYIANIPKWQAPAVHMTITADGTELQPLSESSSRHSETKILPTEHGLGTNNGGLTSYTPLYESSIYDVARSRTWFSFQIPATAKALRVTVISADGHEKSKDFDPSVFQASGR